MIRCLPSRLDMFRSSLADRLNTLAANIQNDDLHCVLTTQSTQQTGTGWQKSTAAGALDTGNSAPVAMAASPASPLSP